MFTITTENLRDHETPHDVQTMLDFTITSEQTEAVYTGWFTMGSAHNVPNLIAAGKLDAYILSSVAYEADLLESEINDTSIRGIVTFLNREMMDDDIDHAFDVAEQLQKLGSWLTKLSIVERDHLAEQRED